MGEDFDLDSILSELFKRGSKRIKEEIRKDFSHSDYDETGFLKEAYEKKKETPLERANSTIRKANARINELKDKLQKLTNQISQLKTNNMFLENENRKLKGQQKGSELSPLEIFGFRERQNRSVTKKRYLQLCNIYHPDKGGSELMMQKINAAYKQLSR